MASLEGLPPLPKSLSGLNIVDFNHFQLGLSQYSVASDQNISGGGGNFSRSFSLTSDTGNLGTSSRFNSNTASNESIIFSRSRNTPPPKDVTPSLSFKQLAETLPLSSARASPIISSSRNTPHGSSRGSPVIVRGFTPPMPATRGTTPPTPNIRGLASITPPPRQNQQNIINTLELSSASLSFRGGRLLNLDAQLAILRKEMVIFLVF